jgi:hypothetical protein
MLFEEAKSQLTGAESAGFDLSDAQAGKLVNRGLRRLASLSKWVRELRQIALTVANQAEYAVADDILEIRALTVGGSAEYVSASLSEIWALQQGSKWLSGDAVGAFSDYYGTDPATSHKLALYPAPTAANLAIVGYCAVIPADYANGAQLPFPSDMDETIIDAARAMAYEDVDENPEMAGYYHSKVNDEAERLRRRANDRVGSNVTRIKVGR